MIKPATVLLPLMFSACQSGPELSGKEYNGVTVHVLNNDVSNQVYSAYRQQEATTAAKWRLVNTAGISEVKRLDGLSAYTTLHDLDMRDNLDDGRVRTHQTITYINEQSGSKLTPGLELRLGRFQSSTIFEENLAFLSDQNEAGNLSPTRYNTEEKVAESDLVAAAWIATMTGFTPDMAKIGEHFCNLSLDCQLGYYVADVNMTGMVSQTNKSPFRVFWNLSFTRDADLTKSMMIHEIGHKAYSEFAKAHNKPNFAAVVLDWAETQDKYAEASRTFRQARKYMSQLGRHKEDLKYKTNSRLRSYYDFQFKYMIEEAADSHFIALWDNSSTANASRKHEAEKQIYELFDYTEAELEIIFSKEWLHGDIVMQCLYGAFNLQRAEDSGMDSSKVDELRQKMRTQIAKRGNEPAQLFDATVLISKATSDYTKLPEVQKELKALSPMPK